MVCDFIKDEFGHAFFTNCKSFKIANDEKITQLELMPMEMKENYDEQVKSIIS